MIQGLFERTLSELAPAERDSSLIQMITAFLILSCAAVLAVRLVFVARQASDLELTETRNHLAAVEGGRAELERLLAGLPVAAFQGRVSASGVYTRRYLSANIAAITGWTTSQMTDADDWERAVEMPTPGSYAAFMRNVLQDGSGMVEYRVRRPEGGLVWVRIRARLTMRNDDGGGEVIGTIADVTNERELALQAAMTSKLSVLGEMASGLAHELNQPITVITLATERALALTSGGPVTGKVATDLRHALDLAATQTRRAADIVDQLRLFGRIDAGQPGPVRLEHALRGAMTLMAGPLRNAEVQLHTDLHPNLPAVLGRLVPIEQVLINLCMNARDALLARPADARRLSITAEWPPRAGAGATGQLRVRVRDTGGGLTEEVMRRVFEPFVTTKAPGVGTGLGLSICKRLMSECGGEIGVRNVEAGGVVIGAEFTLTFQAVAMSAVSTPDNAARAGIADLQKGA